MARNIPIVCAPPFAKGYEDVPTYNGPTISHRCSNSI